MPIRSSSWVFAHEFKDVIVFRRPPPAIQHAVFLALAPIARGRGSGHLSALLPRDDGSAALAARL